MLHWTEQFSVAVAAGSAVDMPCRLTADASAAASIDRIVTQLNSITNRPTPFVVHLTPEETGLKRDLEVDYGDVLMLKSVLLACKASVQHRRAVLGAAIGSWLCAQLDGWFGTAADLLGLSISPIEMPWCDTLHTQARDDWADAVACYLDALACILAESDPQEDELIYIDPARRADIERSSAALVALGEALGAPTRLAEFTAGTRVYEVIDANSVPLGELTLIFDAPAGGQEGRLTLADGTVLEVDWFGLLDAGEIGVSMFAPDRPTQGWFHGAIATDLGTISAGEVELWGASRHLATGITAKLTAGPAPAVALPDPESNVSAPLDELIARAVDEADRGI
jgi:hypothetical protein